MKKNNIFYACAAAALVFASCQKEVTPEVNDAPSTVLDVITATTLSTKTTTIDGVNVLWENGDQIGLWTGPTNRYVSAVYTANLDETASSAEFVRTEDPAPDRYDGYCFALYPASSLNKWASKMETLGTRRVYFNLPTTQTAVAGGWDKKCGILASASNTTEFQFKHIVSYVKFTVAESSTPFVSLTIKANNGESLAGENIGVLYSANAPYVPAYDPTYTSGTYSSSVKIANEGAAEFAPGTYYVAVLPGTFAEGFTLTFENAEGLTAEKKIESEVVMNAGSVANMGTVGTLNYVAPPAELAELELATVYAENGVNQGVVYWINPDDPYKGKVVSVATAEAIQWSESLLWTAKIESTTDGLANYNQFNSSDVYTSQKEKYYALQYCENLRNTLGGNWYLPANMELRTLYQSYYGMSTVPSKANTDYRTDDLTSYMAAKSKFDIALKELGETTTATLDGDADGDGVSDNNGFGDADGVTYWASKINTGGAVQFVRIGTWYNGNTKDMENIKYYVRCVRDVEVK